MLFSLAYWYIPAGYTLPKLLGLSLTAVWASWRMIGRRVPSPAWLLFCLPILLSASVSPDPWLSIIGRYNSYAGGILCLYLCIVLFYSDVDWIFPVGVFLSIHAIYLYHTGVGPFGNRAISLIGSPIDLGIILSVCILSLSGKKIWFLPLMLYALYLTHSRGAWLGLFTGIAYILSKVYVKKYVYIFLTMGIVCSLFLFNPKPISDSARIEVWRAAIQTIKEAPLLGHGPDSFEDAFKRHRSQRFMDIMGNVNGTNRSQADPHNAILAVLCFHGFIGLVAFVIFFYSTGLSAGLVAILTALMFNPSSVEVIALGAILVGRQVVREKEYPWVGRSFLTISILCCCFVFNLCRADYWYQRGNIAKAINIEEYPFYHEATRLNPFEPVYTAALINSIRGRNHELALSAIENLRAYRNCADGESFYALVLRGAGDIKAKAHLDMALLLDPLNPMLNSVRREYK